MKLCELLSLRQIGLNRTLYYLTKMSYSSFFPKVKYASSSGFDSWLFAGVLDSVRSKYRPIGVLAE